MLIEEGIKLYEQGYSLRDLEKVLGHTNTYWSCALREHGVKMRKRGGNYGNQNTKRKVAPEAIAALKEFSRYLKDGEKGDGEVSVVEIGDVAE